MNKYRDIILVTTFMFLIWITKKYQAESATVNGNGLNKCPPVGTELPGNSCNQTQNQKCTNNSDCARYHACCFNGCDKVCWSNASTPEIDWVVEPSLLDLTAIPSALSQTSLTTRQESQTAPICTTIFAQPPSLALGCDVGYICQLDNNSDDLTLEGQSNRGVCISEDLLMPVGPQIKTKMVRDGVETAMLKEKTGDKTVFIPGGCFLTNEESNFVEELKHKSYIINCTCVSGSMECQLKNEKEKKSN